MSSNFFNNKFINSSIQKYLEKKLLKYNNIKYAYAIMNKNNPMKFIVISNLYKWFEIYLQNNLQLNDLVIITAKNRLSPFFWDEGVIINNNLKLNKIFNMANNHSIVKGYCFALHDQYGNLAVLSMIIDNECDLDIEEQIEKDYAELQLLLIKIHEKTLYLYNTESEKSAFQEMINGDLLSKRENEIIYWASLGRSYQEIALIVGIKLTTVKHHMGKAVQKLGAVNAKHAISIAAELEFIRPVISDM